MPAVLKDARSELPPESSGDDDDPVTTQVRVTTRDRAVTLARVVSRPVAALCLLVLVVQVALMVWLARSSAIGQPNDVPVGIATAPLVGKVLADEANALPDGSIEAYVLAAPEARSEVRDGSPVAASHVDIARASVRGRGGQYG